MRASRGRRPKQEQLIKELIAGLERHGRWVLLICLVLLSVFYCYRRLRPFFNSCLCWIDKVVFVPVTYATRDTVQLLFGPISSTEGYATVRVAGRETAITKEQLFCFQQGFIIVCLSAVGYGFLNLFRPDRFVISDTSPVTGAVVAIQSVFLLLLMVCILLLGKRLLVSVFQRYKEQRAMRAAFALYALSLGLTFASNVANVVLTLVSGSTRPMRIDKVVLALALAATVIVWIWGKEPEKSFLST